MLSVPIPMVATVASADVVSMATEKKIAPKPVTRSASTVTAAKLPITSVSVISVGLGPIAVQTVAALITPLVHLARVSESANKKFMHQAL